MRCPFCHNADSRVIDSREADEGQVIRRRRSCSQARPHEAGRGPPPGGRRPLLTARSARGLDALNALVASSQTGFGAFIAVYLTAQAWTQADIGQALSLGTVVAMLSQLPAGALVDAMRSKRLAVALGGV